MARVLFIWSILNGASGLLFVGRLWVRIIGAVDHGRSFPTILGQSSEGHVVVDHFFGSEKAGATVIGGSDHVDVSIAGRGGK